LHKNSIPPFQQVNNRSLISFVEFKYRFLRRNCGKSSRMAVEVFFFFGPVFLLRLTEKDFSLILTRFGIPNFVGHD